MQGQSEQVRAALCIPHIKRDCLLTTALGSAASLVEVTLRAWLVQELALSSIDCHPAHYWHYAVVPSPRHSVSWSLPSPYLCSRRTVPQMCFCSWYPPRCYQHRGLLPSCSFLNSGCKTTIFSWFHRYAKYSSLWNKNRAVKGASFFTILKGYFSRSQGHKLGYDLATYLLHQSSQFCVVPIFELPRSSPLCLYYRPKCVNLPKSLRYNNFFS